MLILWVLENYKKDTEEQIEIYKAFVEQLKAYINPELYFNYEKAPKYSSSKPEESLSDWARRMIAFAKQKKKKNVKR